MFANLGELLGRGGVWFNIAGANPSEAIADAIKTVRFSGGMDREALLAATLEREALMSTAMGEGLAIPHPRSPFADSPERELVALCYLARPLAWGALDGRDVHAIFLVITAGPRTHLPILAQLGHLAKRREFRELLERRSGKEELLAFIGKAAASWGG